MKQKRNISVEILHADDDIIVVNKPSGLIVHRAPGYPDGTLCDILLKDFPDMAGVGSDERPGVVHRLDRDTSGVTVFARTQRAYLALRREFENHGRVRKTYLAVLHGAPKPQTGTLNTLVGRKPFDAKRMAVVDHNGKNAITHWTVLSKHGGLSLVEFIIETGRMHQIRVHAAHLGHPIAGDSLYGDQVRDRRMARTPSRPLLHAVELSLPHPASRRMVTFAAEPPADIIYAR
ncbi:MAG: RluA family pseudouridine synthase [Kiritimatiellae bacterium]|nr:RluA family pseudouridine synthase [Kiritimatiellia bacterium]